MKAFILGTVLMGVVGVFPLTWFVVTGGILSADVWRACALAGIAGALAQLGGIVAGLVGQFRRTR
jgi:hypothetical protein